MARVYTRTPVEERIERHIQRIPIAGCWIWTGGSDNAGYGRIYVGGEMKLSHRVSYELHQGRPIATGLDLDHLCRNPSCVNPHHLEEVTRKENIDRGILAEVHRKRYAARTKCVHGHEYTQENIYIDKRGHRSCKKCRSLSLKNFIRRKYE